MTSGRRVLGNALSIFTSETINRASTFVLYALVGRYLGAADFGRLSLALTYFYVFQVVAAAGLRTLTTREVAKDLGRAGLFFAAGRRVALAFSAGTLLLVVAVVSVLQYPHRTAMVIMLMCLALVPFALAAVCEGLLQAHERMRLIAYATVPASVGRVVVAYTLLSNGRGLYSVVLVIVASYTYTALAELWFVLARLAVPLRLRTSGYTRRLARATRPFLGIDFLIAISSSINVILLSKFANEEDVGIYSAAGQLIVPVGIVFRSIVASAFPVLCRKYLINRRGARLLTEQLTVLLVSIAVPVAVSLYLTADDLLLMIYRSATLALAAVPLRIIVWQVIFASMTSVLGQLLFAASREKKVLNILVVDAISSVVLGTLLIALFGVRGAAFAVLAVGAIDFSLHYVFARNALGGLSVARSVWPCLVAAAVLVVILHLTAADDVLARLSLGLVAYVTTLLALELLARGGFGRLKSHYNSLLAE